MFLKQKFYKSFQCHILVTSLMKFKTMPCLYAALSLSFLQTKYLVTDIVLWTRVAVLAFLSLVNKGGWQRWGLTFLA